MKEIEPSFGFEIDFLPVGDKSKSGDVICMRWGNLHDPLKQNVMVVDGGFAENADDIVAHIRKYYHTTYIDYAVVSHPHADHIGGIKKMLEYAKDNKRVTIMSLWMHNPYNHIDLNKFESEKSKMRTVKESLDENLAAVSEILQIAQDKKIAIVEPFVSLRGFDLGYGVIGYVLGPTKTYYENMLASFNATPSTGAKEERDRIRYTGGVVDADKKTLTSEGNTSAENESSVILCLKLPNGEIVLLTGDAGMDALRQALKVAESHHIGIAENIRVFKVPHHGSIQNLSEDVLDGILGTSSGAGCRNRAFAFILVSKHPEKGHPDKVVTNNIWARNCKPYKTGGTKLCYGIGDCEDRGWVSATPIEKFDKVDNFD